MTDVPQLCLEDLFEAILEVYDNPDCDEVYVKTESGAIVRLYGVSVTLLDEEESDDEDFERWGFSIDGYEIMPTGKGGGGDAV